MFIYIFLGWVELVRDLLSKSHKLYRGVIFQPMYEWSLTLNPFWHLSVKMFFPPHHNNSLIYLFRCSCGSCYTGRTNQRLDARVKHTPTKIRNFVGGPANNLRNTYGSSVTEHLINNRDCAENFSIDLLSILSHTLHFIWKYLRQFIFCPADRLSVNRGNVCSDLILFRHSLQSNIFLHPK